MGNQSDLGKQVKRFKQERDQLKQTNAQLQAYAKTVQSQYEEAVVQRNAMLQSLQQTRAMVTAIVAQEGHVTIKQETIDQIDSGELIGVEIDSDEDGNRVLIPTWNSDEEDEDAEA